MEPEEHNPCPPCCSAERAKTALWGHRGGKGGGGRAAQDCPADHIRSIRHCAWHSVGALKCYWDEVKSPISKNRTETLPSKPQVLQRQSISHPSSKVLRRVINTLPLLPLFAFVLGTTADRPPPRPPRDCGGPLLACLPSAPAFSSAVSAACCPCSWLLTSLAAFSPLHFAGSASSSWHFRESPGAPTQPAGLSSSAFISGVIVSSLLMLNANYLILNPEFSPDAYSSI